MRALILAPFAEPSLTLLRTRVEVVHEDWLATRRIWDPDELGARLAVEDIAVLVVEADFVFREVFEQAPGLRLVGVCRSALNQVDLEAATEHGVAVTRAAGRNTNAVAEITLGLMLSLARRLPDAYTLVAGGGWVDPALGYRTFRGREIAGSTVGIVGFGQIGRDVARACTALGATVIAHDPYVDDAEMRASGVEPLALADLAARADFVTLHLPESTATRRLIDVGFLAAMKPAAYLVNTSGGSIVDTTALVEALERNAIAGAALDVFEGHPLPQSSPLLTAPRLILTPHIGGATHETIARHSAIITDEIERLLDGRPLRHLANPDYALACAG